MGYPIIETLEMLKNKFERRFATHQNAIDMFGDRWASKIEADCVKTPTN